MNMDFKCVCVRVYRDTLFVIVIYLEKIFFFFKNYSDTKDTNTFFLKELRSNFYFYEESEKFYFSNCFFSLYIR